jgi:inosine-uridine nucleoside N-ribohydrolase
VPERIAGISAVAGNAPLDVTQQTARALAAQLRIPYRPAAQLADALEKGPLTILALGPLTNVATALRARPRLAGNVERLIAVMGRRPGHLFHPTEGADGAMLLGHGPVFRDFNFELDRQAAAEILALDIPLVLVPYDAARSVEITAAKLDRLAAQGGASAWVAESARGWLTYWNEDIGRAGFYPFDLMAAAYVIAPDRFGCARVLAGIGKDMLFLAPWRKSALLVTQRPQELEAAQPVREATYCPGLRPGVAPAGIFP